MIKQLSTVGPSSLSPLALDIAKFQVQISGGILSIDFAVILLDNTTSELNPVWTR